MTHYGEKSDIWFFHEKEGRKKVSLKFWSAQVFFSTERKNTHKNSTIFIRWVDHNKSFINSSSSFVEFFDYKKASCDKGCQGSHSLGFRSIRNPEPVWKIVFMYFWIRDCLLQPVFYFRTSHYGFPGSRERETHPTSGFPGTHSRSCVPGFFGTGIHPRSGFLWT